MSAGGLIGDLVMMMLSIGPMSVTTLVENLQNEFTSQQVYYSLWHLRKAGLVTRTKATPDSEYVYSKVKL